MKPGQYTQLFTDYRALLPYSLLGILAGVTSALVILGFYFLITRISSLWLGDYGAESFENLASWQQFALPVAGAVVMGVIFSALRPNDREVGIVHVLSRMDSHYGQLPIRNALVQFFGAAIALSTGQSGGREGPGVHLGAAVNSAIAHRLSLPNNSQRILIACGTAGGIAVAFNTPLAGVIFAMEVIVAEYTVIGFTPVILAAVSATAIRRAVDNSATFVIPPVELASLLELPFILLLGICAGAITALFIYLLKRSLSLSHYPVLWRFTAAGIITGSLALWVPEILGMGYDSVNRTLLGELAPMLMLAIIGCKLIATACSIGLGLPIGLIGPNLLIGACIGGLFGYWGGALFPELSSDPTLYVVIGMGAAMAAVLNAPLAAILAVVELTQNVLVVFPSMLAIVAATLTCTIVFKQRSAHQTVLRHLQRDTSDDPISMMLHQTSVLQVMDKNLSILPHLLQPSDIVDLKPGKWCLVLRDGDPLYLLNGAELESLLDSWQQQQPCDITEQSLRRWSVASLGQRATLREVMNTMREQTVEAIIVEDANISSENPIRGVITRDTIAHYYLGKF
jgi:CIC family chloride channel protein